MNTSENQIVVYQPNDTVRLDVRLENETVWLTQSQMAVLLGCSTDNIGLHLKNVYSVGELSREATTEDFSVVRLTVPLNAEHSPEAPDTPQKNGDTVVGETREKTRKKTNWTREKTREKIIRFLVEKPSATQDDIAAMTGLSIKGIEWNLKALKESGHIRRVGPDKGGHWEVIG